jgi:hypothetical protein
VATSPIETNTSLADELAKRKESVRFAGGHLFIALNMPDEFLKELLARVQPILATSTR